MPSKARLRDRLQTMTKRLRALERAIEDHRHLIRHHEQALQRLEETVASHEHSLRVLLARAQQEEYRRQFAQRVHGDDQGD